MAVYGDIKIEGPDVYGIQFKTIGSNAGGIAAGIAVVSLYYFGYRNLIINLLIFITVILTFFVSTACGEAIIEKGISFASILVGLVFLLPTMAIDWGAYVLARKLYFQIQKIKTEQ